MHVCGRTVIERFVCELARMWKSEYLIQKVSNQKQKNDQGKIKIGSEC